MVQDFEYGFMEPSRVTPGRCTLRQAMQFITDHNSDPEKWTRQKIAEEYKLKEENVGELVHGRSMIRTPEYLGASRRDKVDAFLFKAAPLYRSDEQITCIGFGFTLQHCTVGLFISY